MQKVRYETRYVKSAASGLGLACKNRYLMNFVEAATPTAIVFHNPSGSKFSGEIVPGGQVEIGIFGSSDPQSPSPEVGSITDAGEENLTAMTPSVGIRL